MSISPLSTGVSPLLPEPTYCQRACFLVWWHLLPPSIFLIADGYVTIRRPFIISFTADVHLLVSDGLITFSSCLLSTGLFNEGDRTSVSWHAYCACHPIMVWVACLDTLPIIFCSSLCSRPYQNQGHIHAFPIVFDRVEWLLHEELRWAVLFVVLVPFGALIDMCGG